MGYVRRLSSDLDRWIDQGWVDQGHRESILDDARSRSRHWSAAGALAILGASLLIMSALSFVAANWDGLPPIARIGILVTGLWASFLGTGFSFQRGRPVIGHALALLGCGLFGLSILLIAQSFHMSSFRNTAILITALGALATAIALPSRPVLILATLLAGVWAIAETANPFMPDLIWSYLPLWAVMAVAANRTRSLTSFNLLAIGLVAWSWHALWVLLDNGRLSVFEMASAGTLLAGTIAMLGALARDRQLTGGGVVSGWGAALALFGGHSLQWPLANYWRWNVVEGREGDGRWLDLFGEGSAYPLLMLALLAFLLVAGLLRRADKRIGTGNLIAFIVAGLTAAALPLLARALGDGGLLILRLGVGAAYFALAITLIVQGARDGRRFIGGVGITAFIVQTLYIYTETFRNLLDVSLFFLVGGVLLVGISWGLLRLRKGLSAGPPSDVSEPANQTEETPS